MKKNRTLLIDAQVFQSHAIHRGVGKYSFSLLKELAKKSNFYTNKALIFNKASLDKPTLDKVKSISKDFEIVFLDLKTADLDGLSRYKAVERKNKEVIDTFINNRFPDSDIDFFILSLFQQSECPTFPKLPSRKYLLVYDLIPLLAPTLYLRDKASAIRYLSRFGVFYEADHFFTISKSVATDLTVHIGIPKERITPIYGAPVNLKKSYPQAVDGLRGRKFILLPSGNDPRKNNSRAVLAFQAFNRKRGGDFSLVITSFFDESAKNKLTSLCKDLFFTGNVTDEQMAWLYQNSSLVLFPSSIEGLGLPVLEAVEFNKPVVCSDLDVFREIGEEGFNFCDPNSVSSIEEGITNAIKLGENTKTDLYKGLSPSYSWENAAKLFINEIRDPIETNLQEKRAKIAIFAPSPSGYSAIGKFVQEQHYIFSKFATIDYFLETGVSTKAKGAKLRENLLSFAANSKDPWSFTDEDNAKYDFVIYHIGNSEYHLATLVKALSYPSTVVIHDPNLEGLFQVARSEGLITNDRFEAEKRLQDLIKPKDAKFITSLLSKQKQIVIHSDHAKASVKSALVELNNQLPKIIELNLTTPTPYSIDHSKKKDPTVFTILLAGIVHEAKGPEIVEDLTKSRFGRQKISIKILGFSLLSSESEGRLAGMQNVEVIHSPSDERFIDEIRNCDLIVNFRSDYRGEPSLTVLESMRWGKAAIVNKEGWFDKLPDELVYKAKSRNEVLGLIEKVARQESETLAKKRYDFVSKNFSGVDYVRKILK